MAQDNERMFRQVGMSQASQARHSPCRCSSLTPLHWSNLQGSRDAGTHANTQSSVPGPSPACLQLNFVRTRLMGQLAGLDPAVPDIGKLARELQVGVSGGPAFAVGGWRKERRWVVCSLLDGWKDGRNGAAC